MGETQHGWIYRTVRLREDGGGKRKNANRDTVGKAFGIAYDHRIIIPYKKVTNDIYLCGRSNSSYYNTLINETGGRALDRVYRGLPVSA